jgi:protein-tyrosine phosphatase
MAEALLRAALGPGIRVESAGLGAREGYAPHPRAIQVMAERGIDITRSRSRQVTPAMALAADLILVMDRDQQDRCVALAPGTRGRVHLLGRWLAPGRQEIPDPLGQPDRAFQGALELIIQSVAAWGDRLRQHRGTP